MLELVHYLVLEEGGGGCFYVPGEISAVHSVINTPASKPQARYQICLGSADSAWGRVGIASLLGVKLILLGVCLG